MLPEIAQITQFSRYHQYLASGVAWVFAFAIFNLDAIAESNESKQEITKAFLYESRKTEDIKTRDISPFWTQTIDPSTERVEQNILYPLYTRNSFGDESRHQILQLLSWTTTAPEKKISKNHVARGFTLFPIYFYRQKTSTTPGYWALVPIYGTLRNRLFKDIIEFSLFPLYARTVKTGLVTKNFLYPFFHLRTGKETKGWGFWPLVGHEKRNSYQKLNSWNEMEDVQGYSKEFFIWPFGFRNILDKSDGTKSKEYAIIPLFRSLRSKDRDSTTLGWPFFTYTHDREQKYKEWAFPWPLVIFSRGAGKKLNRVWPFYSYGEKGAARSGFLLWPFYLKRTIDSQPLYKTRDRILFFLYSKTKVKNVETGNQSRRESLWPLFTSSSDLEGNSVFSTLSILEPLLPADDELHRSWGPLWTLYKKRKNQKDNSVEWNSFLNIFQGYKNQEKRSWKFLYGLVSREKTKSTKCWKLFGFPITKKSTTIDSQPLEPHNLTQ